MASLEKILNKIIDKIETPRASLLLINILKDEGKAELAIKGCHKVLEVFPDDINIRKFLAETYFEQGNMDLAEKELEKLSEQINELCYIFKLKAELFKKEGRHMEAIDSLKLYLAHHRSDKEATELLSELSPPESEAQTVLPTPTLAELYFKQGETEEAITIYQQVVEASPDDERSKIRLNELREMQEAEERREATGRTAIEKKLWLIDTLERWLAAVEKRRTLSPSH